MALSIFLGYCLIGLLVAWKSGICEILEEDPELSPVHVAVYQIPIVRLIVGVICITIATLFWPVKVFIWIIRSMKHRS